MASKRSQGRIKVLPEFAWDARAGRYRDLSTGRFVGRNVIIDLLRAVVDTSATRLEQLAAMAARGEIPAGLFQQAAMLELKNLHLASAALGAGGWDRLTQADFGRVGGILRGEYVYLARFARDLEKKDLTEAQAMARARLYAGKGYAQYYKAEMVRKQRAAERKGKVLMVRWHTLGDNRVCADCARYGAMGWQPVGTFPVPGDGSTACLGNCRCSLEYRESDEVAG